MRPLIQVALDFTSLSRALKTAEKVCEYVDVLEAGTPLIKSEGMRAVRILKDKFPKKLITADTKTADAGKVEAELAFKNGADILTVLWIQKATVIEVQNIAKRLHKKIVVDILQDKIQTPQELVSLSPSYIGVHLGLDSQKGKYTIVEKLKTFTNIFKSSSIKFAVAGGITPETIDSFAFFNIGIIIVGGYITKSLNPEKRAKEIKEAVMEVKWKSILKG